MNFIKSVIEKKRSEIRFISKFEEKTFKKRSFLKAISGKDQFSLIAEIKRKSPSHSRIFKGKFDAAKIAKIYEKSGAKAISVLTDEKFFGGGLNYLSQAKKATKKTPILAKDFFIDEKQILAAAAAGADAILLIVKILSPQKLKGLLAFCHKQGLEAVVEVGNKRELKTALAAKAEIIGINNRNLDNFRLNTGTTFKLAKLIPKGKTVISMSGLHGREAQMFKGIIDAVLVGTKIMEKSSPKLIQEKIKEFSSYRPLLKICGIRDVEIAKFCEKEGVDFIGFNFVPDSKRRVLVEDALEIRPNLKRTKVVGIFQNEALNLVNKAVSDLDLDFVQLHGKESPSYCSRVNCPVIKALSVTPENRQKLQKAINKYKEVADIFLFDGDKPGAGSGYSRKILKDVKIDKPYFIAGGVNANNAERIIRKFKPLGIDVASGAEENGATSKKKILKLLKIVNKDFIKN